MLKLLRYPHAALAMAGLLAVTSASEVAYAGDDDIVFLANGGRLRGTVFEEDPSRGVTIKLIDGTTRTLAPGDVQRVQYGARAAAAPAAPPPAAAPTTPAAPGPAAAPAPYWATGSTPYPAAWTPGRDARDGNKERGRRSVGLMVTGIVVGGLGAGALGVGVAVFTQSFGGSQCSTAHWSYYDQAYVYEYEACDDETMRNVGIGMMIGGGASLGLGLFMALFGGSARGGSDRGSLAPSAVPEIRVGLRDARVRWAF